MVSFAALLLPAAFFAFLLGRVTSTVVLFTPSNDSTPFPDVEATFAPTIPQIGIIGWLFAADPSNACVPLQAYDAKHNVLPAFILVARGDCDFVTKVQFAQDAGYAAAIIYNNEDDGDLITMSGNGYGISIPAVFITKEAGQTLLQYAGDVDVRLYMLPAVHNTAWSVLVVSFLTLLAASTILSTFFVLWRQQLRPHGSQHLNQGSARLSKGELKALIISVYNRKANASCDMCAVCLEEYVNGEKVRVLPCGHEFHVPCVDHWLTTRKAFCPICKRDAHGKNVKDVPSETTPLLAASARESIIAASESVASEASVSESTPEIAGDIC